MAKDVMTSLYGKNDHMDITNLMCCRLNNYVHQRASKFDDGCISYIEYDPNIYSLSLKKANGKAISLTSWDELFTPPGKSWNASIEKLMARKGFSDHDLYIIIIFLSRLALLFRIDNRPRTNKDIFLIFYTLQLNGIKCGSLKNKEEMMNFIFQRLFFELAIDKDERTRFSIKNNVIIFQSTQSGEVQLTEVIHTLYEILLAKYPLQQVALLAMKDFQLSVINYLVENDQMQQLPYDDRNIPLIYPEAFCEYYKNDKKIIFNALIDCVAQNQSNRELVISNLILMNYSVHILKNKPKDILKLKKAVKNDELFKLILTALIHRDAHISKEIFYGYGLESILSEIPNAYFSFYNIIYFTISKYQPT